MPQNDGSGQWANLPSTVIHTFKVVMSQVMTKQQRSAVFYFGTVMSRNPQLEKSHVHMKNDERERRLQLHTSKTGVQRTARYQALHDTKRKLINKT